MSTIMSTHTFDTELPTAADSTADNLIDAGLSNIPGIVPAEVVPPEASCEMPMQPLSDLHPAVDVKGWPTSIRLLVVNSVMWFAR